MMRYFLFLIILTTVAAACGRSPAPPISVSTPKPAPEAPAPAPAGAHDEHAGEDAARITLAEAKKAFDEGNAIFIDTRAAIAYEAEHIKGAENLVADQVAAKYSNLPANKKIIAYCS